MLHIDPGRERIRQKEILLKIALNVLFFRSELTAAVDSALVSQLDTFDLVLWDTLRLLHGACEVASGQ